MACMTNLTYLVHKLYVFRLVDNYGVYWPMTGLTLVSFIGWFMLRDQFLKLAEKKLASWHVSGAAIKQL